MPERGLLHSTLKKTEWRALVIPNHCSHPWHGSDNGLIWILNAEMMETLCLHYRDEFIYQTMYEIDVRKYDHYREDLKEFNNAEEILLQVITTCMWAHEYHEKTQ